jgi:lipopolysaccharide biosynthesis glycosyltransferase
VRRDLERLWRTELEGNPCAAVREARIAFLGSPDGPPWRTLDIDPHAPYCNTGVLVVDLDQWRSEDGTAARSGDRLG